MANSLHLYIEVTLPVIYNLDKYLTVSTVIEKLCIKSFQNRDDFSEFETINLTERVLDHSSGDEI